MTGTTSTRGQLGVIHDTGTPQGSQTYTTLVVLHGHNWHSGTFLKVVPLASSYDTRIILINRRGYPGSTLFTDEERAAIPKLTPEADQDARRGLILGGTVDDLAHGYVRRLVIFDTGNLVMAYPGRSDTYSRGFDTSLPEEERTAAYDVWARAQKISSYYSHGPTIDNLSHEALDDPPSTLSTLSADERAELAHLPGGAVDSAIVFPGIQSGLFATLRRRAFFLSGTEEDDEGDSWRDVEFRVVWCQMSHAEVSYIMHLLIAELEHAKANGVPLRKVRIVRVKGGNHFVQWDQPEIAMRALVGDEDVI